MKAKKLKKIIPSLEYFKLNSVARLLTKISDSSKKVIFRRKPAKCSLYNSKDIRTNGFYKNISLILDETAYRFLSEK